MMPDDKSDKGPGSDPAEERPAKPVAVSAYAVPAAPAPARRHVTIYELWQALFEYKVAILAIVFVITSIAIVVSLMMRPVYRSQILLAPANSDSAQGGLSALAGQFGGLAALAGVDIAGVGRDSNEAIAILRSRGFTEDFIVSENLMPILFYKKWDAENQQWDVDDEEDIPTMEKAYLQFDNSVRSISQDLKTGLVQVSIDLHDRELAAGVANRLVEKLNNHVREKDIQVAERSIEFLNKELEKHSMLGVKQGIFSLIEKQIETIMLANVQEEYAFKILDAATVPDSDNRLRPKRKLMVIVAFTFAWFFAIFLILLKISWRNIAVE
jgi:uncharacterized protein involved in exopolysaccharide biosynthesis